MANDDILPPDRADSSRILGAAQELVAALARRTPDGTARVTVRLGPAEWRALEAETRRPYRPHAKSTYVAHPEGCGAVTFERGENRDGPGRDMAEAHRAAVVRGLERSLQLLRAWWQSVRARRAEEERRRRFVTGEMMWKTDAQQAEALARATSVWAGPPALTPADLESPPVPIHGAGSAVVDEPLVTAGGLWREGR